MSFQNTRQSLCMALLAAALLLPVTAQADVRYAHEHVIHELPREHMVYEHGGEHYYFAHGYWYRGHGPEFIAVAPPFGLRVGVLPYGYRTVVVAGLSYFVLNDIWYQQLGNEYVVVAPPAGAPVAVTPPPATIAAAPSGQDIFIYPRNGQGEQQQSQDRYECHRWAVQQTGFDPTQPLGGVPANLAGQKHSDYQRAMSACLDGRGYTVR